MLDITEIKSVSSRRVFFNNNTHREMNPVIAAEIYEITTHLIYAIPVLQKISDDTHNIPFKEYAEIDCLNWVDKINIEISNKYARLENEKLSGSREKSREILETFMKYKHINKICREYLNAHK